MSEGDDNGPFTVTVERGYKIYKNDDNYKGIFCSSDVDMRLGQYPSARFLNYFTGLMASQDEKEREQFFSYLDNFANMFKIHLQPELHDVEPMEESLLWFLSQKELFDKIVLFKVISPNPKLPGDTLAKHIFGRCGPVINLQ